MDFDPSAQLFNVTPDTSPIPTPRPETLRDLGRGGETRFENQVIDFVLRQFFCPRGSTPFERL